MRDCRPGYATNASLFVTLRRMVRDRDGPSPM